MPTFTVSAQITVSAWTTVEADSEEEALAIARNRDTATVTICGSFPDDEYWHLDSDGVPTGLTTDG